MFAAGLVVGALVAYGAAAHILGKVLALSTRTPEEEARLLHPSTGPHLIGSNVIPIDRHQSPPDPAA